MKKLINNWYIVSLLLAVILAAFAFVEREDGTRLFLLASGAVLSIHFFEEFGYPGGFPLLGVRVMLGSDETDSTKWNCNNLNSWLSNWLCLLLVYLMPLILPNVHFLLLSAIILSVAELMMHLIIFTLRQKKVYNPGIVTTLVGLTPILIWFLTKHFDAGMYHWYEWIIAFVYFVICFGLCFRSPIYWKLGGLEGYPLSDQTAYGFEKDTIRS